MQWLTNYIGQYGPQIQSVAKVVLTVMAIGFSIIPVTHMVKSASKKQGGTDWPAFFKASLGLVITIGVPIIAYSGVKHLAETAGKNFDKDLKGAKMIEMLPAFVALGAYEWQCMKSKFKNKSDQLV